MSEASRSERGGEGDEWVGLTVPGPVDPGFVDALTDGVVGRVREPATVVVEGEGLELPGGHGLDHGARVFVTYSSARGGVLCQSISAAGGGGG